MKTKSLLIISFIFFCFSVYSANAQCGVNMLTNPGFESPVQPVIGENHTGVSAYGGWTNTNAAPFVIVKTAPTYPNGPDNAYDGIQFLDVQGATATIYQDFTISGSTKFVSYGGQFSSRGPHPFYSNWVGSVSIQSLPSMTVVASSSTGLFHNGVNQEIWSPAVGITSLPPGNYRFSATFGDFGNFDGAYLYQDCALPVTLQYFEGDYKNNEVALTWKAESVSNFSHFEVEKSTNGTLFESLKRVPVSDTAIYHCTDRELTKASTYYYRLKMVDADGKFVYSRIIKINTGDNSTFTVLKNPASNTLALAGMQANGIIRVMDMSGKIVLQQNVQSQSLSADISYLRKGLYIVQYTHGETTSSRKFLIQ
ncbi:MAG: T9SS type A sorting domain-containing protein [Bacteroidetes bacterium]|nr:T9SS type A sorting domain-containing protein [Bacteroidota bacterium]